MSATGAQQVRQQQREWARRRGIAFDEEGYVHDLANNLFQPMSVQTRDEFSAGDGGELGKNGQRGKMQALHSSAALACNVFDYWRGRDSRPLARAMAVGGERVEIGLERKYPTGLLGRSPNLDVVLEGGADLVTAIESKFLEWCAPHAAAFRASYFPPGAGLWADRGMLKTQALAEALHSGSQSFTLLYAAQLLKHLLGLAHSVGHGWRLVYLWYEVPGEATREHADEARRFADAVASDGVEFRVLTYRELFLRLRAEAGPEHQPYLNYLQERYFRDAG